MRKCLWLLGLLLVSGECFTQSLSKTEQQIVSNVDEDMSATLQLLKESVNINSGTFNMKGVKKTGELYGKELAALGFTVEWILMPD